MQKSNSKFLLSQEITTPICANVARCNGQRIQTLFRSSGLIVSSAAGQDISRVGDKCFSI